MRLHGSLRAFGVGVILSLTLSACADDDPGRVLVQQSASPTPSVSPTPLPTFRFAVLGDYGSGWPSQHDVADRMCAWREEHPFDDVITTGDNIYPDGAKRYFQQRFFSPYDCLFTGDVEFHAALGNHDFVTREGRDVLEEPAFGMPKRQYVYREGGVRFVIADSNRLDREWLSEALRPRPTDRWTVVVFHHPVYSPSPSRPSEPGYRPSLPRLFRERGVDLVLNGHAHIYFASKPLRKIRYVVTGGGGASLYTCSEKWFVEKCQARNHFVYVVATPERITVRAIPPVGSPFHKFTTQGR